MREISPGVWELIVQSGKDPVTGKYRQVTRRFRGKLSDAKKARAELLAEVGQGRHQGTAATMDDLFGEWLVELSRKGRSPKTINNYRQTYRHNISPTLGSKRVPKVTTKMLTDLYGAHQRRGLSARSVYQIHATLSAMLTQACRWGWRNSNPAQWADPPIVDTAPPVVPTPAEVAQLVDAAMASKRPEQGRAILVAATTGLRRGEICGVRRSDVLFDERALVVHRSIVEIEGQGGLEGRTKNRRARTIAVDDRTLEVIRAQVEAVDKRSTKAGVALAENPYLFSDALDGSAPWRPGAISLFFRRVRGRVGLGHLSFHSLRKFMDTYGEDLGFSRSQVALRAGHDPAVAARHYIGKVDETDRQLAAAISELLMFSGTDFG